MLSRWCRVILFAGLVGLFWGCGGCEDSTDLNADAGDVADTSELDADASDADAADEDDASDDTGDTTDTGDAADTEDADASDIDDAGDTSDDVFDATPDPVDCPMGEDDGCCPLLRYGGTDPDCPSLACDNFEMTEPILFDDESTSQKGRVSTIFDGTDLVSVREDGEEIVFERRDLSGELVDDPVRFEIPGTPTSRNGMTALEWEPSTDTFLFARTTTDQFHLMGIDADGELLWDTLAGGLCLADEAMVEIFASQGRFVFVSQHRGCASSDPAYPLVEIYEPDGTPGPSWNLSDGEQPHLSTVSSFTCDVGCERLLASWYRAWEGDLRGRFVDLSSDTVDDGFELDSYTAQTPHPYHGQLAYDGTAYLRHVGWTDRSDRVHQWEEGSDGWSGDTHTFNSNQAALPPSLVWTGGGYILTQSQFSNPASGRTDYYSVVYHLEPDGEIRESFAVDDEESTMHPSATWAYDRIALTWVQTPEEERYLAFLTYP